MKQALKNLAYNSISRANRALMPVVDHIHWTQVNKADQIMLSLKYQELVWQKRPLPSFRDIGFRNFSQFEEDGILLFLFAILGTTNRKAVEICAGDGIEANIANLLVYHGWHGYFVDGNAKNVERGNIFYRNCRETVIIPPIFEHAWVDTDTVNDLLLRNGFEGEVDLFSLDMDGVDYWIWKALTAIRPRVVVVEYNSGLGPDLALTVPYRRDFVSSQESFPFYMGASLNAFVKLGKEKGYRLVGCNSEGFNGFFVREDIAGDLLPEVSPEECINVPAKDREQLIKLAQAKGEWVSV